MISPLLFAFALQLVIHLINTIGKPTINETLWLLYTKLPTTHSREAQELAKLRSDVVRLNREMNATSAQDEFAKWAKLRRQHDKAKERYDSRAQAFQSFRSTFDRVASSLRWLGTQGLQFGCNFYYGKEAMFWLPQGWMPYPVEWILACPRAPLGSISINVWCIACGSVLALVTEGLLAVWTLRSGEVKEGPRKGEKVVVDVPVSGKKKQKSDGVREKKEL